MKYLMNIVFEIPFRLGFDINSDYYSTIEKIPNSITKHFALGNLVIEKSFIT